MDIIGEVASECAGDEVMEDVPMAVLASDLLLFCCRYCVIGEERLMALVSMSPSGDTPPMPPRVAMPAMLPMPGNPPMLPGNPRGEPGWPPGLPKPWGNSPDATAWAWASWGNIAAMESRECFPLLALWLPLLPFSGGDERSQGKGSNGGMLGRPAGGT